MSPFALIGACANAGAALWEARRHPERYDAADTLTSVGHAMLATVAGVVLGPIVGLAVLQASRASSTAWHLNGSLEWGAAIAAAVLLDDFAWYWTHRAAHAVPALWWSHRVHHSSSEFNYTTAAREPWSWSLLPTWAPWAAIAYSGEPLALLSAVRGASLLVQILVHTKGKGWASAWALSPSSHRVHHGVNAQYIDKNFGGLLMIWDKAFGTYEPEREAVVYGVKP